MWWSQKNLEDKPLCHLMLLLSIEIWEVASVWQNSDDPDNDEKCVSNSHLS